MLKRVPTSDIELGMFIHKLEGSWFKHPFWKSRFLLTDEKTLDSLLNSDVPSVVIDTERGLDVRPVRREATGGAVADRAPVRRPMPSPAPRLRAVAPAASADPYAPTTTAKEFGRCRKNMVHVGRVVSRVFLEARLGKAISSQDVEPVIEEVYASVQRNLYAFNGLLRCQQDNEYVYRHSLAVSALMIALARQLKLSPIDMRDAGMAGLLMDVGVGQLPVDEIPPQGDYRALPPDLLEQHVLLGHALLKSAGDIPPRVVEACLNHHERLDGTGYPNKLAGLEIDLFGRMSAICDCYDNFVSGGAGKPALDPAEAIRALVAMGPKLDRDVLRAFVETLGVYPIGSFVKLRSERLAMVVDEDPADTTRPTVRTFYSLILEKRIRSETIALANCFGEDEIVGIADLTGLDIPDVADLRASILSSFGREAA